MIDAEYFNEPGEARRVLSQIESLVDSVTRRPTRLKLLTELDAATEDRIHHLKDEVFRSGPEVFDARGLAEVTADPEAMFLVLEIDGAIEGFCFGYYEEPGQETVAGTDFFIDTALCSSKFQNQGIAQVAGAGVLLLVHLLGDVRRVGIAVWDGGRAGDLMTFYRKFGFVETECKRCPYPCMTVVIDDDRVTRWRAALGLSADTVGT